jgi:hypothetical protein
MALVGVLANVRLTNVDDTVTCSLENKKTFTTKNFVQVYVKSWYYRHVYDGMWKTKCPLKEKIYVDVVKGAVPSSHAVSRLAACMGMFVVLPVGDLDKNNPNLKQL